MDSMDCPAGRTRSKKVLEDIPIRSMGLEEDEEEEEEEEPAKMCGSSVQLFADIDKELENDNSIGSSPHTMFEESALPWDREDGPFTRIITGLDGDEDMEDLDYDEEEGAAFALGAYYDDDPRGIDRELFYDSDGVDILDDDTLPMGVEEEEMESNAHSTGAYAGSVEKRTIYKSRQFVENVPPSEFVDDDYDDDDDEWSESEGAEGSDIMGSSDGSGGEEEDDDDDDDNDEEDHIEAHLWPLYSSFACSWVDESSGIPDLLQELKGRIKPETFVETTPFHKRVFETHITPCLSIGMSLPEPIRWAVTHWCASFVPLGRTTEGKCQACNRSPRWLSGRIDLHVSGYRDSGDDKMPAASYRVGSSCYSRLEAVGRYYRTLRECMVAISAENDREEAGDSDTMHELIEQYWNMLRTCIENMESALERNRSYEMRGSTFK